ncbi:MAG: hypothetical protein KIH62_000345 [Candidatus Kerfeldbacteria bacterium]|nr:hypothetical protein [Candidatus Kerfeldbacteria bacterium]
MNLKQRITDFHNNAVAAETMPDATRLRVHDHIFVQRRSLLAPLSLSLGGLALVAGGFFLWNNAAQQQTPLTNSIINSIAHALTPTQALAESLASTFDSATLSNAFGFNTSSTLHQRIFEITQPYAEDTDEQSRTYTVWTQNQSIAIKQSIPATQELSGTLVNTTANIMCFTSTESSECKSIDDYAEEFEDTYAGLFSETVDDTWVTDVQFTPVVSNLNAAGVIAAITTTQPLPAHGSHIQFLSQSTNSGSDMVNHGNQNSVDAITTNIPTTDGYIQQHPFYWSNIDDVVYVQLYDGQRYSPLYVYNRMTGIIEQKTFDDLRAFVRPNALRLSVVGDVEQALSPLRYLISNPDAYVAPEVIDYRTSENSVEHVRIALDWKARMQMPIDAARSAEFMDVWYDTSTSTLKRFSLLDSSGATIIYDVNIKDTIRDDAEAHIFDQEYWESLFAQ